MPVLGKQAISSYLRSNCQRRLFLDLHPDTATVLPDTRTAKAENQALGLPPRQVGRVGLQELAAAGEEWEEAKLNDLASTFGIRSIVGVSKQSQGGGYTFAEAPLATLLPQVATSGFIVQAQFEITKSFEQALGIQNHRPQLNLEYTQLRPDLIQILDPDGSAERQEVAPDGTTTSIPQTDQRFALRVIDIKLTAEASVPYFIEATLYTMALAAWLIEHGWDHRFYVLPMPTVWPGSHDAAAVVRIQQEHKNNGTKATEAELLAALDEDLETGEFGVFAPRLRRFLQLDLLAILSGNWAQLPWHVDNRCIGCEYLGFPWTGATVDPNHCWPMADAQGHLSRIAFVSRGACTSLRSNQIGNVSSLAGTAPNSTAFDSHHTLRATRTVVSGRAQALTAQQVSIPPQTGTSAVMPAWADLRVYLTADFDIGSGITTAFGFSAVWATSKNNVGPNGTNYQRFNPQAFPVDLRSLHCEERELLNLLAAVDAALQWAHKQYSNATVQVYLWDSVSYDHLVRVIGRYLPSILNNRQLKRLAWLFPPDLIVPNPELSDRMSPITVLREVIRATLAAPIPHYYSLLNVARVYHSSYTKPPYNQFIVPPFFEDPLSDQIPSERAHEIWRRAGGKRPWNLQLQNLQRAVCTKVNALENIAQRLGDDLKGTLNQTAPRISDLSSPTLPRGVATDSRLWFVFTKLDVSLSKLEIQQIQAMPPHEREAKFKSAILDRQIVGTAEAQALANFGLPPAPNRRVYELSPRSTEVRAKEGDFTFAASPIQFAGFLGTKLSRVAGGIPLPLKKNQVLFSPMEFVTQVTFKAIDRTNAIAVVDFDSAWWPTVAALEAAGLVDLTQDVIIDPVHRDFLCKRLEATLRALGNPSAAATNAVPKVAKSTGQAQAPAVTPNSPAGDLFWDATKLFQASVPRALTNAKLLLKQNGYDLNPSQWDAWERSLTHRLRLIWGPPGTGKSQTLRAIVLGALHEAHARNATLRILITGPTYEAIDNVLLKVNSELTGASPLALPSTVVCRLRSSTRPPNSRVPASIDVETSKSSQTFAQLASDLVSVAGLYVVGATPLQAQRLLEASGSSMSPLFDLVLMDEASQIDVPQSTLPLAGIANDGSAIIVGDPKQLPPIHKASPPEGLDYMVGSIFSYFETRFSLPLEMLQTNYRSCRTIVSLAHLAKYPKALTANSPDLAISFTSALPTAATPPANWPQQLAWSPAWSEMLAPDKPAVCFVYPEGRSSQWNHFEADSIAALSWLLCGRLGDGLTNEVAPAGAKSGPAQSTYAAKDFWEKGVGIVTPHRAQQALIVGRLQSIFGPQAAPHIRDAVDTVERFQGQQRDVMLATFALGDPDAIADEDEFLLSLNRFNVMASRARAKLVVFVSQELVDHLSSDMDVLKDSALIKSFVENFCANSQQLQLPHLQSGGMTLVPGDLRWHT